VDRKPELLQQGKFKAKYEGTDPLPIGIRKQSMVMAESSVYFEAYRCVLQALQKISPNHFPMKPYILGENVEPNPPRYLDDIERVLTYLFNRLENILIPRFSIDSRCMIYLLFGRPKRLLPSPKMYVRTKKKKFVIHQISVRSGLVVAYV